MSAQAELRCRCGQVRGRVTDASPRTVTRVICYCDDCQTFAHHLGRADLLDPHGGSDIIQMAPATLTFTHGQQHVAGLRLSPKGLCRWHTTCCNTPVGNTVSPRIPFVGIVAQAFDRPDETFGKPIGGILGKYAIGDVPAASKGMGASILLRAVGKVLGWRLRGKTWPHPFFARDTGAPIYPVSVVPRERREAMRRLCGPHPAAHAGEQVR
jgi:hypothetical protein